MSEVQIRPVRPDDAEALNVMRRLPGVMEFTLGMPSERVEANRRFIEGLGPDTHMFVAECEGRVVGMAELALRRGKQRNTGMIGIGVHDEYAGRGIGRQLMQTLLDLADNYLALHRVELEVLADNARAIHLYESLGFQVEGRKRQDHFRHGVFVDTLMMGRLSATPGE